MSDLETAMEEGVSAESEADEVVAERGHARLFNGRIAIIIPHHEGNVSEAEECRDSFLWSFKACGLTEPEWFMVRGTKIGDGSTYSMERDTEIWRTRERGQIAAYSSGCDFFYHADSDVRVPPDWAFWATAILPRDAVAFPVINWDSWDGHFTNDRFERESLDTLHPLRSAELYGFSRKVWEAMVARGPVWGSPNEDYHLNLAVRAAGFRFTNGRCRVVAY